MKYRTTSWLLLYLFTFSACFFISGCQNSDDDYPVYLITGEWFYEESGNGQTNFSTVEFKNGVYKQLLVWVGLLDNTYQWTEGTYSYNKNIDIVYTTKYDKRQYHEVWIINNADNYTLDVRSSGYAPEHHVLHRIIDTYQMSLGENRTISISDSNFKAVSYASCDEKVASVDDSGTIQALKRGTTFIRVFSGAGEVVIRVEVADPNNSIDDYSEFLGEPISKASALFDIYNELPAGNGITFFVPSFFDTKVRSLSFMYLIDDFVYRIDGSFNDDVDISSVVETFDKKYTNHSLNEGVYYYIVNKNGRQIRILIDSQTLAFTYQLTPNAFEEFDKMVKVNIDDFAAWFGYDLYDFPYSDIFATDIDNEIFSEVFVVYDETTRKIDGLILTCMDGVESSDIEGWYEEHYYLHNHPKLGNIYATHKSFPRSEFYIKIEKDDMGKINVSYINL